MRTYFQTALLALTLAPVLSAQTETFDIATFVPPSGWQRSVSNGVLVFQDRQMVGGRVEFGEIYLFPSRPARASAQEEFGVEWQGKVVGPLRIAVQPQMEPVTADPGWTAILGIADAQTFKVILVVATGFGKEVTVVATFSGAPQQAAIGRFLEKLDLHGTSDPSRPRTVPAAPTDPAPPGAPAGPLPDYRFAIPAGWTRQDSNQGIVLVSPFLTGGERCQITMLPMQASGGDLSADALNSFRTLLNADPLTFSPYPWPKLERGVSPQGWEYFIIRKAVGGSEGDARLMGTILMTVKIGGQFATIVATSKRPLVSSCFGEAIHDEWPKFFSSIGFGNAAPAAQPAALRQKLAGSWMMATGSVGDSYTFLANGRFLGAAASMTRSRISDTQILETTRGFFGNGAYSIEGNTIVLKRDDGTRNVRLFRLGQFSKDGGKTWTDRLCMMDPGWSGEVCYQRQ